MRCAPFRQIAWTLPVLCIPSLAHAQAPAKTAPLYVTLEYDAPDQCLDPREFKAIVKKRLGRDPFVEGSPNRVLVLVSQAGSGLSGDILWRDETGSSTGQQRFPSTTGHCPQLIEGMAFALAVQIQLLETEVEEQQAKSTSQAGAGTSAPPAKSAEPPPPPAPPAPSSDPPSASKGSQQPVRGVAPFLGGGAGAAFGMASSVLPAGRVFGGLRWTALALELGVEASIPIITRREDGAGFSQWYLASSAAGCALFGPWSACALLKVGTVQVSGRDIDVPNSAGAPLVQSGLRLALSQHLGARVSLSLRAEGLVNLTRWSVNLDQSSLWSAPRFAATSGLDFTVLFL